MSTKNIFIYSLTLFILLFAIGCNRMDNQVPIDRADEVSADDIGEINNTVLAANSEAWGTEEYVINAATIEDDALRVNLSYSGGCETHDFTLVAEPMFLESYPVQLRVSLAHNPNGDICEASITEDRQFDLTPIKEAYQKAYRTDTGTIVLRLKDAPPSSLTYEF